MTAVASVPAAARVGATPRVHRRAWLRGWADRRRAGRSSRRRSRGLLNRRRCSALRRQGLRQRGFFGRMVDDGDAPHALDVHLFARGDVHVVSHVRRHPLEVLVAFGDRTIAQQMQLLAAVTAILMMS